MLFFEAFDQLDVKDDIKEVFKTVQVKRILMSKSTCSVRVFVESDHILTYQVRRKVEYELRKQILGDAVRNIRIIESYQLSKQYTPEKIMPMYFDSILAELKEESILDYNIVKEAKMTFIPEAVKLTVDDTFMVKKRAAYIKEKLDEIYRERFSFSVGVIFEYVEPKKKEVKEKEYVMARPASIKKEEPVKKEETPKREETKKQEYSYRPKHPKLPEDPFVIYGRNFDGDVLEINDIQDEIGEVVVRGKVIFVEPRELRNEKTLLIFGLTDFTDTITCKIFLKNEQVPDVTGKIKKGSFLKLKGMALLDRYDKEISISSIVGVKAIEDFTVTRKDESPRKRVELHAHTLMSDMDAVVDVKDLVKRAMRWGHPAIAITDHGVVQSFPEANHCIQKGDDFKIIYGMEAYLVDDLKEICENIKGQAIYDTCVVFDIETTGFGPVNDQIIEIGAVKVVNGQIVDKYSTFINPDVPIPYHITQLTGITDEMVMDSPKIDVILPEFLAFCKDAILVAHNASFDVGFLNKKAEFLGIETDFTVVDTVGIARLLLPHLSRFKLNVVAKELGISLENHHRAVDDAGATAEIFVKFIEMLEEKGIHTLEELEALNVMTPEMIKKLPTYHAIILAKNDTGRVNLYKMVSMSHIDYYQRRPRIPKSLLQKNREGLLLGSACEAGELYQAILRERPQEEIDRLARFYDYFEIQPLGNNQFMIEDDKFDIKSKEDLIVLNKRIIALGEEYNKLVVGTCDVHFLDPEDEVFRRIIMAGKGFKDADSQPPLYLRTTEEMVEEFMYLGREKAEEIVIDNTNKIADMIERISPVRPDKCPPVIENSDQQLRDICYSKATSMYGKDLPVQVSERLEKELTSIIGNGFAVMYIIAQKLVWKSNEDGYLVGSRGSVGSSFVATMSGITEVNPLPAHYYCTNCFYSDFDSEEVRAFAGKSGCDMPDKACPVCGKPLSKDGHEIPFETFLGFYGDKEPDIDLNFSGEYQAKAHDYTEVIFGKGQTFRAGTIGTLAEKTAYGFVLKYNEEHEVHKRRSEVERIAQGCVGVRRTTGQHPGGIVVLPLGEEIYSFTPVQRPANDMTTKTVTTHFDYHSIDHNLLKLDILGHDDPTMIRLLEDLTGLNAQTIRLDDEKVLSLFENLSALNITKEDLGGCDLGSLGIPEFGTDFVMQMLRDTKPKTFSDLVRISGLSHGTDVWLNNAQYYIAKGDCTLSTAICTRDDIMTYLIHTGVENGLAFKIMESVRKGKGLTPDMESAMIEAGVPEWYIESCKKIKYMFPKAHAAAYVMMAFRIAYFKVYYPLAYYCAFFSIRASAFNYELMCLGRERLEFYIADYKKRSSELTKKEQDTLKDMRIVQEMYARGFDFMPINLYTAKAHLFQIIDGKLMPSFSTIDGLGDKAAEAIVEAVKQGKFLSRDDFKQRCKVSGTVVEVMADLGILEDMPISNQMSILDFMNA
ncbi:PolC-type DNA polymerase III [[Clostridium] polysaccharolyticum]|uniref:DNA polymerase III PolC-type n=1 Tax=[Clostridium] polysaccharolyticum TaxID=29364 RepID=A0A1I0B4C6_9FIRM|nr:PolC-type DNA polymerase III [[Clostridium] polysaccharolyticum]SET01336.1 DNA polymerase-3 subunit alpha [[Clostridium] polysaccharolyticum]